MLTPDQIKSFHDNGYLVVQDVVSDSLKGVKDEYERTLDPIWKGWVQEGRVQDTPEFEDRIIAAYQAECEYFQPLDISLPTGEIEPDVPMHTGPEIFKLMRHPRLLDLVEDLIGSEITSNPIQHVRIKPPARDMRDGEMRAHITKTLWHQDRGVTQTVADETNMITVWIAVSDATLDNGCLQVLKGSHAKDDLLPHCPLPQIGIPDEFIDETDVRPVPVKAGGVVIFHPMCAHNSRENHTDGIRWSFDIRYNVTGEPTGRAQFPEWIARSQKDPNSELKDPKEWAKRWDEARARLSAKSVTEFYRWDQNAPYCA